MPNCLNCGKEFQQLLNSSRKYCTRSCRMRYNKAKLRKHPNLLPICRQCGQGFERTSTKQIFCSRACCNTYHYRTSGRNVPSEPPTLPPMPTRISPSMKQLLQLFYNEYPDPVPLSSIIDDGSYHALTRLVVDGMCAVTASTKDTQTPRYRLTQDSLQRLAQWDAT